MKYHDHLEELVEERTEALRESEEKFRYFFNNAQVGLFWSRISDGKFLECNDIFAKLVGYDTREECLANYIALEHYVDSNIRDEMLEEIRINDEIKDFEIQVTKRDGTPYWASISARTNLKENRIEGAAIDVTDRKKIQKELQLERDNLINILNSMEDGVYIVDKNYDIEYANPILIKEFGQYEGKKCYKYFNDRNESCPWCKIQEVFEGKTVRWEWYSFKNQKTYDLIDTPLKNVDGSISKLEIFHDITERKKNEQKLKESEEKYRTITEGSHLAISIIQDDIVKYTNQKMADLTGYSIEEILSWKPKEYAKVIAPDSLEQVIEQVTKKQRGDPDVLVHYPIHVRISLGR
jgi:PAS domain S-box-containing protein